MNDNYDYTADGTLYYNDLMGMISLNPFSDEEMPPEGCVYWLHKRRRYWILEKLEDNSVEVDIEAHTDMIDTPKSAYVCFAVEIDSDYVEFEDDDFNVYIDWDGEETMADIIKATNEYLGGC